MGAYSIAPFVKDLTSSVKAFANSKGDGKKLMNDFISTMQATSGMGLNYRPVPSVGSWMLPQICCSHWATN
jgi:hypothetical protein